MISLDLEYVFRNENAYQAMYNKIKWLRNADIQLIMLFWELLENGREQYRKDKEYKRWLESNV